MVERTAAGRRVLAKNIAHPYAGIATAVPSRLGCSVPRIIVPLRIVVFVPSHKRLARSLAVDVQAGALPLAAQKLEQRHPHRPDLPRPAFANRPCSPIPAVPLQLM